MELELHVHGTRVAQNLRRYAERRFRFALRRFARRVRRLRIYVADINGPRGGGDKQCRILADVAPSGRLVLTETDTHMHAAVDRAAHRLKHTLRRDIQRRHARKVGKVHTGSIRFPETAHQAGAELPAGL